MKTKTVTRTVADLIEKRSVESVSWTEQEDGQLVDLTIRFIPAEAGK